MTLGKASLQLAFLIKRIFKFLVRSTAHCLPPVATEIAVRLVPRIGAVVGSAHGDYGFIRSTSSDSVLLPVYAKTGTWAKVTNDILIDLFAGRGGTYFDIGANIGLTTIPVAQNPLVKCRAFEPEPVNFANLGDNVRRNAKHGNVEIHQVAIVDHRGSVALGINENHMGDHRVDFNGGDERHMVNVPAARLDDFYDRILGPLAVKIDTQGAEPLVVASGPMTLAKADLIIMEFWPHGMREIGSNPETVIDFIGSLAKVAVMKAEGDAAPVYQSPAQACAELRSLVRDQGTRYVDVVGWR